MPRSAIRATVIRGLRLPKKRRNTGLSAKYRIAANNTGPSDSPIKISVCSRRSGFVLLISGICSFSPGDPASRPVHLASYFSSGNTQNTQSSCTAGLPGDSDPVRRMFSDAATVAWRSGQCSAATLASVVIPAHDLQVGCPKLSDLCSSVSPTGVHKISTDALRRQVRSDAIYPRSLSSVRVNETLKLTRNDAKLDTCFTLHWPLHNAAQVHCFWARSVRRSR
jgi:hypothetical protein